ncbi:hypothetical protein GLUCOINTEAF2_0202119 [Komagataeibacter intermedius AF2]|uniref:Uncharacterized protein n=1 Tax=Komagataeibacter intermedius AF2 TaxID=1458464 RepID=A0A0C1V0N0_9PROT|nr:hypothetical protein GLUCOINTEAF2_0203310 [Komagataeibacter intermedius AF2]KPH87282.1 hypothetical protein GLUCOINTEAF2_0202119 [Komagataeibacter intermedius AF2]
MILRQHIGVPAQDFRHVQHEVAKVAGVYLPQALLVIGIDFGAPAIGEIRILRRRDGVGHQPAVLPSLDHAHYGLWRPALGIDTVGFENLFEQTQLVIGIKDGEAAGQPDIFRMAAQHARAQGMERAQPQPFRRFT